MKVGIGGGVGPIRGGISNRGLGAGFGPLSVGTSWRGGGGGCGTLIGAVLAVGVVLLVLYIVVALLPIAGVITAVYLFTTGRHRSLGVALTIASVALAWWLWPKYLDAADKAQHSKEVPHDIEGIFVTVKQAERRLAQAGFERVKVVTSGDASPVDPDAFCWVDHVVPAPGADADYRESITIYQTCSGSAD